MSQRKPLAALASLTTALALAVPVASASAHGTKHHEGKKVKIAIRLEHESLPCELLGHSLEVKLPELLGLLPGVVVKADCEGQTK